MTRVSIAVAAIFFLLAPVVPPAFAQPARTARLVVTVADPSGAIIPNASVTLAGLEGVDRP
jgi:hypothetical protein